MDKAGNFIGYLFVDNTNLSVHLVQEGYASMHFTAERGGYANQIRNAEDNAKNAKRKIWANYTGEEDKVRLHFSMFLRSLVIYFHARSQISMWTNPNQVNINF